MVGSFVIFNAGWTDVGEALALTLMVSGLSGSVWSLGVLSLADDGLLQPEPPTDTPDGFTTELHLIWSRERMAWVCGMVALGTSLSLPGLMVQPVLSMMEALGVSGLAWAVAGLTLGLVALGCRMTAAIRLQGRVLTAGRRSVVIHRPREQIRLHPGGLQIDGPEGRIELAGPRLQLEAIAERLLALPALPGACDEIPGALQALERRGLQPPSTARAVANGRASPRRRS